MKSFPPRGCGIPTLAVLLFAPAVGSSTSHDIAWLRERTSALIR